MLVMIKPNIFRSQKSQCALPFQDVYKSKASVVNDLQHGRSFGLRPQKDRSSFRISEQVWRDGPWCLGCNLGQPYHGLAPYQTNHKATQTQRWGTWHSTFCNTPTKVPRVYFEDYVLNSLNLPTHLWILPTLAWVCKSISLANVIGLLITTTLTLTQNIIFVADKETYNVLSFLLDISW